MFVRNISIVMATNVAKTGLGILGSILLVRTYGLAVTGEIALAAGLAGIPTMVSDLGFSSAYSKFLASDREGQPRYLGAYALIKALLLIPFAAAAVIAYHFAGPDAWMFAAAFATFLLVPFADITNSTLSGLRSFSTLSALELTAKSAVFAATLVLVILYRNKYAVAMLPAIDPLLKTGYLLVMLAKGGVRIERPDKALLKRYWGYTLPLMFTQAVSTSMNYLDRIFLGKLVGLQELGTYAVAQRVYSGLDVLVKPLTTNLFTEFAARMAADKDFLGTRFKDVLAVLNVLGALVVLSALFLSAPALRIMYGPEAAPAALTIAFFTLVMWCKLFFRPYHSVMLITENHAIMSYLGILNLPLLILFYSTLIPLQVGGRVLGGSAIPLTECLQWLFPTGAYILYFMAKRGLPTHSPWLLIRIHLPFALLVPMAFFTGFGLGFYPLYLAVFLALEYRLGVLTPYRIGFVLSPLSGLAKRLGLKLPFVPKSDS